MTHQIARLGFPAHGPRMRPSQPQTPLHTLHTDDWLSGVRPQPAYAQSDDIDMHRPHDTVHDRENGGLKNARDGEVGSDSGDPVT